MILWVSEALESEKSAPPAGEDTSASENTAGNDRTPVVEARSARGFTLVATRDDFEFFAVGADDSQRGKTAAREG